jgi:hypothetical protein
VLRDVALAEQDRALGIQAGGDEEREQVVGARPKLDRVELDRDRVQVDDAVDRRVTALLAGEIAEEPADVVAQVLGARGLDSGEDDHDGRRVPRGHPAAA